MSSRDRLDVAITSDIKELDLSIKPTTCEKEIVYRRESNTCTATAWVSIELCFLWPEILIGRVLTAEGLPGPI
jgi:hypothetical protein